MRLYLFSSQFTSSSAPFTLVSSSTSVIFFCLSCLLAHTMPESDKEVRDQVEAVFSFHPCLSMANPCKHRVLPLGSSWCTCYGAYSILYCVIYLTTISLIYC